MSCENEENIVEETEFDRCYICLEVSEDKSPCDCGIPVHRKCLVTLTMKTQSDSCTVCKSRLVGIPEIARIIGRKRENIEYSEPGDSPCKNTMVTLMLCVHALFVYVLLGWAGKLFILFLGHETESFFSFWTADHLVATSTMCIIIFVLNHFLRCDAHIPIEPSTPSETRASIAEAQVANLPL